MYDKIYDVPVPAHRAINAIVNLEHEVLATLMDGATPEDMPLLTEVAALFTTEREDLDKYTQSVYDSE